MKLIVFNGSPRGRKSNTSILLDQFTQGYQKDTGYPFEIVYLIHTKDVQTHVDLFKQAENVIIAFPLYTDAMPGIVKMFIEALEPLCGAKNNPHLGFIVQSGFPEPFHSRFVERYLAKLAKRLNCEYIGTVVKGGVEGIQVMPPWMTKKLFNRFYRLGSYFAQNAVFDPELLKQLAPREKMSFARIRLFKLLQKTGLTHVYWNDQLKKNGAFDNRFDRPYS
jgi:NAD(P)H-dependent FMN reductase